MPPAALLRNALAIALLALPGTAAPIRAATAGLAEQDLLFEIRRDGSPVGTHRVTIRRDGAGLRAEARSSIAVRLLGVTIYRFDYNSVSSWVDGRLARLDVVTDDDGTVTRVSAKAEGGRLRIVAPDGVAEAPLDLLSTDHWNPKVIGATAVLNTITGQVNRVTMTAQGRDSVPAGSGKRLATRYVYAGELDSTVWYDDSGHWTGLRFAARDGSIIDYVCKRCGPDAELAERAR